METIIQSPRIIMLDEAVWCVALEENQYAVENPQIYWETKRHKIMESTSGRDSRKTQNSVCGPQKVVKNPIFQT